MNLPNDVSRCVGVLGWSGPLGGTLEPDACPHRAKCERYLQLARDREKGIDHYRGMSVISNCIVNGEYTMRIET